MSPLTVNELLAIDASRSVIHHDGRLVCRCACGDLLTAFDNGTSIRWAVEKHNRSASHQTWRARRG